MFSPHHATVEVNLSAIVQNWQLLRQTHSKQHCAAVVKANAYGLGVEPVSAALADAGCTHFFVATLAEAVELRRLLTSQFIYVFSGVQKGEEHYFLEYNLLPVINDWSQFERWEKAVENIDAAPAALHVDTGMNRLGFTLDDIEKLALEPERVAKAQIKLLMSHLACASDPAHPLNQQQVDRFLHARKCLPMLPASLANSAGIFLGKEYHHEMGRPGCALYGINPSDERPNPMQGVVTLTAPILQIRMVTAEFEPVGYSATVEVPRGTRIATVGIGYADGLHRILSGSQFGGYIGGHFAPLLGRVSMDLVMLDITRIPADVCYPTARVEFIGAHQLVDKVASAAQTIGYEVLTSLSPRVARVYR
jgi:alanine racemase